VFGTVAGSMRSWKQRQKVSEMWGVHTDLHVKTGGRFEQPTLGL